MTAGGSQRLGKLSEFLTQLNPPAAKLSGKHRAKSVPPKPKCLVADVDAAVHAEDLPHSTAKAETAHTS
jgi:hypothetical protein